MTTPVTYESLVAYVSELRPVPDAIASLSDAVTMGEQLDELSDAVIGHFVELAREEGASWSRIGESLGVTRQAAHQRFVKAEPLDPDRPFARFTDFARFALVAARAEAGLAPIGIDELVAGLRAVPGIASRLLGAEPVAPMAALPPTPLALSRMPLDARAAASLAAAASEARRLGREYIGTEHVLLGILTDGAAAQSLGLEPADVEAAL